MMFAISQSELNTFRTCRQKWKLKYLDGLVPTHRSDALRAGSLFHQALEVMYRNLFEGLSLGGMLERCLTFVDRAVIGDESFDAVDAMDTTDMRQRVRDMVERYIVAFYLRDVSTFAEVVGVEYQFVVPVRWLKDSLDTGRVPGARYIGGVDVVLRMRDSQEIVVMEHKTTGSDASQFDARFDVDPQTPGYVWAVRESLMNERGISLHNRQGYDQNYGRVFLNAIRRTGPKQPKVNQNGLVSTAACDTTHAIYDAALAEQAQRGHAVTPKQSEMLVSLPTTMDKWTCRHEWRYSGGEIERWFDELRADAALLRQSRLGNIAPSRNGSACAYAHQPKCDMRHACVLNATTDAMTSGSVPLYTKRDTSFEGRIKPKGGA